MYSSFTISKAGKAAAHSYVRVICTKKGFPLLKCLWRLLLLCFLSMSLQAQQKQPDISAAEKTTLIYTYKIVDAANNTFGYDIYSNGKLKIHQPSVPAMPGNEGFKTKAAAEKVAQLVIKKMEKGESLPTVSVDEMKKLKAL